MKKLCLLLAILMLALSIAGCGAKAKSKTHSIKKYDSSKLEATQGSEPIMPTEPETEPTPPPTTQPPTTVPPTTMPPTSSEPYYQKIVDPDQAVYTGPGYHYDYARTIGEEGVFTIVEEVWDGEGYLWGKLKSGIGWVNLSEIRGDTLDKAPIEADYADDALINSGRYFYFEDNVFEFPVEVVFRAKEDLTDVRLYSGTFKDSGVEADELLFQLPSLTAQMPLLALLEFPGDMSTYFIRFFDSTGTEHSYAVYTSGYDGSLICSKQW